MFIVVNRSSTSQTCHQHKLSPISVTNITMSPTFRMQNRVQMMKMPRRRRVAKVKFLMMDKIIPDSLKLLNYRIDFWLISVTHFYDSSYLFIRDYAGWVMNYDNIKTTIIYSLTFARGQVKNQLKRLKLKQLKLINWKLLTRTDNELTFKLELMQRERKMDSVRVPQTVRDGLDR